jgi:hypothetical protein
MNLQGILAEIETNGGRLHHGRLLWLVAFIDDQVWHIDAGSGGRPLHHFGCTCYHPLFLFNQPAALERRMVGLWGRYLGNSWLS